MAILPVSQQSQGEEARIQYISPYVSDLRSTIGYYTGWIREDYHDIETFYEVLENDATVKHALHLLSLMAAGEFFEIKGPHEKWNHLAVGALRNIRNFTHSRKSMCEKSVLYGLAVQKKVWERRKIYGFPGMWEVPVALNEVDRRRIRIERDAEDKTRYYYTIWCPRTDRYMVLEDRSVTPNASLAIQDFLWYRFEQEETAPYGKGLGEVLYGLAYVKSKVMQYWADLCEHWGTPFLSAKINSARAAFDAASTVGSGMQDSSTLVSNWLDLLDKMRSKHALVMPDHDSLEIHEAGTTGNNLLHQFLEYCDRRIELLLLGAELTTTAPSVGSYAMGQLHRGATESVVKYIRSGQEEIFEQDLLFDFYLRNRQRCKSIGAEYPGIGGFRLCIGVEQDDLQKQALEQGQGGPGQPGNAQMKQLGITP